MNTNIRKLCKKKSAFLGIQKHIAASIAGGFIGVTVDGWRESHMAERDAVLRRYVELHPEDFPDESKCLKNSRSDKNCKLFNCILERKKYGELLMEWVPVR